VILVWGSLEDPPIARVLDAVDDGVTDVAHLDDSEIGRLRYNIDLGPEPSGWLELDGQQVGIERIRALYLRPGNQADAGAEATSAMLLSVAGSLSAIVVNRPAAGRSNHSKPYQCTLLAAAGLPTPDTFVTTDPRAAREFLTQHGRIVYKSISGVRSVVTAVDAVDADRLDGIGHGPVQLQEWIEGLDIRVHIVGDRWFATAVESDLTDYRYGGSERHPPVLTPFDVPERLGERLVTIASGMGLLVAGVDLRRTATGDWYCLEVNPSPGFTFYENHTGQPIAAAIAALLRGDSQRSAPTTSSLGPRGPCRNPL
jgi:glutathione synthase/RimK-type ligase-like ATP-grasp enzyme